jgi:parallel beta-helix repeat protein
VIGTAIAVLAFVVVTLASPHTALPRVWYVAPDGSGDAPTIQAGIDSAEAGDTILLANGTYVGAGNPSIRYRGKSVCVRSESGRLDLCTVDCLYAARGFIFDPGDGPEAILEGLTITRGMAFEPAPPADSGGAGIWCDAASPTIRNVRITDCHAGFYGGGMWCSGGGAPVLDDLVIAGNVAPAGAGMFSRDSHPILSNVTFLDNYAGVNGTGGGMYCEGGAPRFTGVRFEENLADWGTGGQVLTENCRAQLTNVEFVANVGLNGTGGLYCSSSSPLITNCIFSGNTGAWAGGIRLTGTSAPQIGGCTFYGNKGSIGGAVACYGASSPVIVGTILAWSTEGEAIFCDPYGTSTVTLACCDIYANAGGDWVGCISGQCGRNGNFSADPLFCDTEAVDLTLEECSPCLPGNHPDGYDCLGMIGAFGSGCECGSGPEPTTWGSIKAIYR